MMLSRWLALGVLTLVMVGEAQAEQTPRTISVSGTAEIEIEPEFVSWEIELIDNDADPVKAKAANDERFEALLKLAKKMDIDRKDVIIGRVSINKRMERNEQREYVFKGYDVERRIVIVQRELDEFDDMLASLASFKAEFEISYGSDKVIEARKDARLKAVAAARDKANAMAGVLGQKVGKPISIEERVFRPQLSNNSFSNYAENRVGEAARFSSIMVSASVDIQFELTGD